MAFIDPKRLELIAYSRSSLPSKKMERTGSGFFRFENRSTSTWSNNASSADREVDLDLRLGLKAPEEERQEAPKQGEGVRPQNVPNNIDIPTLHHQGMENRGILQNSGGLESERELNHKPWPLPVLNMLSFNCSNISAGNSVMQQQQQQKRCKICQKTETPLWRKGPDGPKTLCNGCGLRYARENKRT